MKHHKSVKMYEPATQCNIKTFYQMLQLSAYVPNLCPQPKSSVINRVINDRLLDAWPTVIQTSPQLINISHRILIYPLLYHCRDSVIYVLKSGMLWSHRLGAITKVRHLEQQSCSMVSRGTCTARCAGVINFQNLSWFHISDYIKNIEYV